MCTNFKSDVFLKVNNVIRKRPDTSFAQDERCVRYTRPARPGVPVSSTNSRAVTGHVSWPGPETCFCLSTWHVSRPGPETCQVTDLARPGVPGSSTNKRSVTWHVSWPGRETCFCLSTWHVSWPGHKTCQVTDFYLFYFFDHTKTHSNSLLIGAWSGQPWPSRSDLLSGRQLPLMRSTQMSLSARPANGQSEFDCVCVC